MSERGFDLIRVGETSRERRQVVSSEDILQFARLTGDFERIHVDEEYAKTTEYQRCIAHGILLLGHMSSGLLGEERVGPNVSYGYDRIRFIRPIFVGDAVSIVGQVIEIRTERQEVVVEERLLNEAGELAVIAHHVYKFL